MGVITGGVQLVEGSYGPIYNAGVPVDGTDSIQTITFGTGITGGTFKLAWYGFTTSAITWTATDATLVANIDAALGALPNVGSASNVTAADTTVTSGIGDVTVTFVAALGKMAIPVMTVADNSLTGTTHEITIVDTTPGVAATGRGMAKGATIVDVTNGDLYMNSGTAAAPTWGLVAVQT